ncbi:MAG: glycerophosphodiester phosphodiesterase family protein [Cellulosilyticaceae bacterium]
MKKMRKKIGLSAMLMISIGLMSISTFASSTPWYLTNNLIAHGMGSINDVPITNSMEALMQNYINGHRVFEVDLNLTADDYVVAYHDMGTFVKHTGGFYAGSLEQFKSQVLLGKYSTVTLDKLIKLMTVYEDMYIVTDIKDYSKDIFQQYMEQLVNKANEIDPNVLDRIIIQVYNPETLNCARSVYDFKNLIFTTYASNMTDAQVVKFAKDENIKVVTTPVSRLSKKFIDELHNNGIKVYTHTINDLNEIETLKQLNVDGYYTDTLTYDKVINFR